MALAIDHIYFTLGKNIMNQYKVWRHWKVKNLSGTSVADQLMGKSHATQKCESRKIDSQMKQYDEMNYWNWDQIQTNHLWRWDRFVWMLETKHVRGLIT